MPIAIDDELVLLDGWHVAMSLNSTAALIWSSLDGETNLGELAADISSIGGVDEQAVVADVVRFIGDLAGMGLLEGAEPDDSGPGIHLQIVPPPAPGDVVDDLELRDLDGIERRLTDRTAGSTTLLVNWNPHCGYCARVAPELASRQSDLAMAGCTLVLVASGTAEANRVAAERAGLDAPIVLLSPGQDLFRGAGTPSAYFLDQEGRLVGPPAFGAHDVQALAYAAAGVDEPTTATGPTDNVGYLLQRDGLCAPGAGAEDCTTWEGTRVYRVAGHHVGIRHDSEATANTLDRLFVGRRVDDSRAGHSFSVALQSPAMEGAGTGPHRLNLLLEAGRPPVRSRNPARVLQALLIELTGAIAAFDPLCGHLQVDAIAVLHRRGAALLPRSLNAFAPRLQALLAREGIALIDVRSPVVDPVTMELVVPEAAVDHDPSTLESVAVTVTVAPANELSLVKPGRYPLTTWCAVTPGPSGITRLSPAEAAAATLSSVLHTSDAPERVRDLGRLFSQVCGVGIWYDSEREMIATVVEALRADPS